MRNRLKYITRTEKHLRSFCRSIYNSELGIDFHSSEHYFKKWTKKQFNVSVANYYDRIIHKTMRLLFILITFV